MQLQGRYVVAAEDIVPGEVIAVETPNASFAHYDREKDMSKVCHHCLKSFETDLMVKIFRFALLQNLHAKVDKNVSML